MSQIYLRFNSIKLEDHFGSRCSTAYDKISIYDGNSSASPLLDTLCGSTSPLSFTSTSNAVYMEFISDSRVQSEGFHASYKFIYPSTTTTTTTTATTTTSVTTGAITHLRSLLNKTDISNDKTAEGTSDHNNSISVNLALHDRSDGHEKLDASFIEPTELQDGDDPNSRNDDIASDPGIIGKHKTLNNHKWIQDNGFLILDTYQLWNIQQAGMVAS